jgi:hypothetical protein
MVSQSILITFMFELVITIPHVACNCLSEFLITVSHERMMLHLKTVARFLRLGSDLRDWIFGYNIH